ncbi:MAG: 16S rRNA (cytidine(1402)-2'-O)-methyltransferase [Firmicutes bacterium]|nr:16S rRNA (cytidine(1402)-2'-O)-methyltransferase [Bacillota bacterium]
MSGTLFVCGTPIGNIEDMTLRCLRTLKECDLIAAEDTRQSVKLLNHYDIKTPLTSYHEHNKAEKGPQLVRRLLDGKNIALVTDAGMPGISDPGEDMIKLCYENGIPVTVVPGPTAAVTALVLSGLSSRSYVFEGFLPSGKNARKQVLEGLKNQTATIILYEAPHHLKNTLKELADTLGSRPAACVKELTKRYENVNKLPLDKLAAYYEQNEPKGEFVIVIEGREYRDIEEEKQAEAAQMTIEQHFKMYLDKGMDEKSAMKAVAKDRGIGKREVYGIIKGENK